MSQPQSKFSGAFAALRGGSAIPEGEPSASDALTASLPRQKGRPPGKRSNAEYQPTTVFLRRRTKNAAHRLLLDDTNGRDLSDLLEQLLSKWLEEQSTTL